MQAVILAGGQATRMRPYTDDRPKAMVEIAGKPIVQHQIDWLRSNGVGEIVISCGYMSNVLKDFLGDGSSLGVGIVYAVEDEPLGRGGGLKFAAKHLPSPTQYWLALNGDVIARFGLDELVEKHRKVGAVATIALAKYRTTWGIADLDGDQIKGFVQSPVLPYWINAGIYCFEPELTEMLPDKGDHEDSTFPELSKAGRLWAYKIDGYWRGIDNAKDVKEATADIESMGSAD